jgi:DNA-binding CsgD family transcriptional regulator
MAKLVESANDRIPGKSLDSKITWREGEVLRLLVAGQPNREIARILGIDEVTVKGHVGRLMRKRGVTNRIALSMLAANESMTANKVNAELSVGRKR